MMAINLQPCCKLSLKQIMIEFTGYRVFLRSEYIYLHRKYDVELILNGIDREID